MKKKINKLNKTWQISQTQRQFKMANIQNKKQNRIQYNIAITYM